MPVSKSMPFNSPKKGLHNPWSIHVHLFIKTWWNIDFSNHLGKSKLERITGRFKKIEGKHTVFDWWRKVKFCSNYRKPRVQERGGGVCTEATSYKSIGLILTFRQLIIKKIILEKVIQVCFLLFYCNTEPLQDFIDDFPKFRRSLLMKG